MKLIIFEGLDNCFKTTNILRLRDHYVNNGTPTHVLHYSSMKIEPKEDTQIRSEDLYYNMFQIFGRIHSSYSNNNFICDRAHLGEWVYGKIYRGYDATGVFDIETLWMHTEFWNKVYLVFLYDSNINAVLDRDDGLSFSTDYHKKQYELTRFLDAFEKSHIKNKIKIDVCEKNRDSLFNEILTFVEK